MGTERQRWQGNHRSFIACKIQIQSLPASATFLFTDPCIPCPCYYYICNSFLHITLLSRTVTVSASMAPMCILQVQESVGSPFCDQASYPPAMSVTAVKPCREKLNYYYY